MIYLFIFWDCGESSVKSCLSGQNLTAVRNKEGIFSGDWTSSRAGAETHIPYVLHLTQGRHCNLLLFLSGCGWNLSPDSAVAAATMPRCLFQPVCAHPLCAFRCLPYSKNTCRCRTWSTWPVIGSPFFQPCSHPAASKRQMAKQDAAA